MILFIIGVGLAAGAWILMVLNVLGSIGSLFNDSDPFRAFWRVFRRQAVLAIVMVTGIALALIGLAQMIF